MPVLITATVIVVVLLIIIATQSSTNKKLNKHNDQLLKDVLANKKAKDVHFQHLKLITLDNPISAHTQLVELVELSERTDPT